ncbi:neuronal acetylcholine receptor subunit alpha-10 [Plakobranchus ocellatus]|uniref:Neuronal acetylcholine receptor subunit alpha-10 n=1 Tax=Plakobranchus ocellatus TaxID=259542 RepID=A0AAV3YDN9_9GAST|nr:neuronal acetylcholine receptor subunit alpha-10 [Plakobranchus ocellatus]
MWRTGRNGFGMLCPSAGIWSMTAPWGWPNKSLHLILWRQDRVAMTTAAKIMRSSSGEPCSAGDLAPAFTSKKKKGVSHQPEKSKVDVTNRSENVDLSNYVDNGEWELLGTKVIRRVKFYTCCPEPFVDVTFYIMIRRRVLYYFLNVIIPCMMLSSLSLTGFLLPPESGEKVTLGLTVLLAFSVFMLLVAENMPPTSEYIPLIGIYLTVIMAMSALSVALSVFVLNCHHRGISMRRPPRCVRLFSCLVARVLCMRLLHIKDVNADSIEDCRISPSKTPSKYSRSPKKTTVSGGISRGRKPICCTNSTSDCKTNSFASSGGDISCSKSLLNRHNNGVQQRFSGEAEGNTNLLLQKSESGSTKEENTPNINTGSTRSCQLLVDDTTSTATRLHVSPIASSVASTPTRSCCPPPPPPPISSRLAIPNPDCTWCAEFRECGEFATVGQQSSSTGNGVGAGRTRENKKSQVEAQILYYLRAVLETFDKGQGERTAVLEWQEVARVLDKFFFWLFVLITSLTTVFLLLLSPITKNVQFPLE